MALLNRQQSQAQLHSWKGQVAVITGAANGIGRAFARKLSALGMRLLLADIAAEPLKLLVDELAGGPTTLAGADDTHMLTVSAGKGGSVIGINTDIANDFDVRALSMRAFQEYGAVHLLCNSAGVPGLRQSKR
jgi:NAD(P)-dependent dehydrogenase (short-subunit alcohol dehydrogenase family)